MARNTPAWIGIFVLLAAAGYIMATHGLDGPRSVEPDPVARLATGIALLIVILGSAAFGYRGQVNLALKQTLAWLAIGLGAIVIVAYRAEFNQVGGRLLAGQAHALLESRDQGVRAAQTPQSRGPAQTAITAAGNGHFFVEALVDGSHVHFVADTGATLVALSYADAKRIGIDPDALDYRYVHRTANGTVKSAHVMLGEIRVGPITIHDVRASVSQEGRLSESLLGMSFLSKLSSFHIRGDQLILRQ